MNIPQAKHRPIELLRYAGLCCFQYLAILVVLLGMSISCLAAKDEIKPPGRFGKAQPSHLAGNLPTTLTFIWGSSKGAVSYQYCVDTTDNDICDTEWTSSPDNVADAITLDYGTIYYWQARAINESGSAEANSRSWFTLRTKGLEAAGTGVTEHSCPAPQYIADIITTDTTWRNRVKDPSCFDYIVQVELVLSKNVLTIEPGTVVGFEFGLGLRIRGSAGLVAAGTGDEPIVLTGTSHQRGFWKGVLIEGRSFKPHILTFTTIEFTGDGAVKKTQDASLILNRDVTIKLENSTLRQSNGYGLFVGSGVDVVGNGNNLMTQNVRGPAYAYASEVSHLTRGGGSLLGNHVDVVTVWPNTIRDSAIWTTGVYRILRNNSQSFAVQGSLTLGPGVEIRFEADQKMRILNSAGLTATGTKENPIVLTGTEKSPGWWHGLYFINTANPMNRLKHVVIEYGGGDRIGTVAGANLVLMNNSRNKSRVTISNTTLHRGVGYGLHVQSGAKLDEFTGNVLTQNVVGAAYLGASAVGDLLPDNDFHGNAVDEIRVETGSAHTITEDAIWRNFGVPYFLQYLNGPETDVVGAALTLEPGVELLFGPGVGLSIQRGSSLVAVGTPDSIIKIKSKHPGKRWKGLDIMDSSARFDWIKISGAGSGTWGATKEPGNVTIRTVNNLKPPGAHVIFGDKTKLIGGPHNIVFGYGDTIAKGCSKGKVYVHKGDTKAEHCP